MQYISVPFSGTVSASLRASASANVTFFKGRLLSHILYSMWNDVREQCLKQFQCPHAVMLPFVNVWQFRNCQSLIWRICIVLYVYKSKYNTVI
jgi:hypothetical protein